MNSALKYMLSDARGLLWPRPIVLGAQVNASRSPEACLPRGPGLTPG
jgi:hypothetical protein